jgi:Family of unknown function (DUF6152)
MKTKLTSLILAATLLSTLTAFAHHSFTAVYQQNKTVKIEGKIVQFLFRNPHSFVHVMAPDESGNMVRWAIEWQGAGQLGARGVNAEALKPGDPVIVTGNPARDAAEHRIRMVTIKRTTDGFGWGTNPGETVN